MERQDVIRMADWRTTWQASLMRLEYTAVILLLGLSLCCPRIAQSQVIVQGVFNSNAGQQLLNPYNQANVLSSLTPLINPCTSDNYNVGVNCAWPINSQQWPLPQLSFHVEAPYNTSAYNVTWYLATGYTDPCWLSTRTPCPDGATPYNIGFSGSTTGDQPWSPTLQLYGSELAGSVSVQALVKPTNSCGNGVTGKLAFYVWGVNQDPQAQLKYAAQNVNNEALSGEAWFLPIMIGRESHGRQFKAGQTTADRGHPTYGPPDGIGVIQVDRVKHSQYFALDENPYWNFIYNLEDGADVLVHSQQYTGGDCNTPQNEVKNNDCMHYAYDFWDRQVFQACVDSGGSTTPLQSGGPGTEYCNVAIPAAPTYTYTNSSGVSCSFSYPQTTANSYKDALWIQTYNGACQYYILWQNRTRSRAGQWVVNETQACSGTHYVKDVCTATPAYQ